MEINGVELPECTEGVGLEEPTIGEQVAYPDHNKHQLMIRLTGNCPWCGWDHPDTESSLATPEWTVHS